MTKIKKTNAMRILDKEKIEYNIFTYDTSDGRVDGLSVAEKTGQNPDEVFKTLVTRGTSNEYAVYVIPVNKELDLKKAAVAAKEKKIEMIPVKELLKTTGYIKGGCSPIGMKKLFKTFFHSTVLEIEKIVVSGGKIGMQIEIKPKLLLEIINGKTADLIK